MPNTTPELLMAAQTELGECPVWDGRRNRFFFMDITERALHSLDWASRTWSTTPLPALGGGLVLTHDGMLIACLQSGIHRLDSDTGLVTFIADPEPDKPDHRLNEAKCDPRGRLWVGSISTLGRFPTGALYRMDAPDRLVRVLDGISVPNTLVWLADGEHVLFADSAGKLIWRFRYDQVSGGLSERAIFADCTHYRGIPDGACLDADGHIWVAEFGGGCVRRYDSAGQVVSKVDLPATQVTSCAFVGPDLRHLAVITTKRLLNADERAAQTHAGDVFVIEPEVAGIDPHSFA